MRRYIFHKLYHLAWKKISSIWYYFKHINFYRGFHHAFQQFVSQSHSVYLQMYFWFALASIIQALQLLIKDHLTCKNIQKSYLSVALILLIFIYLQLHFLLVISPCNFHFFWPNQLLAKIKQCCQKAMYRNWTHGENMFNVFFPNKIRNFMKFHLLRLWDSGFPW